MCGLFGGVGQATDSTVGQPNTAKTQIGDSGAQAVSQKRKPRSLLAASAIGDPSVAATSSPGAKATLGG